MNHRALLVVPVLALVSTFLSAQQCNTVWRPGSASGTDGQVFASTAWDPDGAGPATPVLVIGGAFSVAGDQAAHSLAMFDPATSRWSRFDNGLAGGVSALTVLPNGDLIAGGRFTIGGSAPVFLARWTGTAWQSYAPGLIGTGPFPLTSGNVRSIAVMPNGDLVAGGAIAAFAVPGASGIARWNGSTWSALGTGSSVDVRAMTVLPNGDLVAMGLFAGGTIEGIGRWDGSAWSGLGTGTVATVNALATLPNGNVVAAGSFSTMGGVAANNIARWDGTTWSPYGTGTNNLVSGLTLLANGGFAIGGLFSSAGGTSSPRVARWDGTQWTALGNGIPGAGTDIVRTMTEMPSGEVFAAGEFSSANGAPGSRVAKWNGSQWMPLSPVFSLQSDAAVTCVARAPNGELVIGGNFSIAGIAGANGIVRGNGLVWNSLGTGVPYNALNVPINAVAISPSGDVIAGGVFATIGGVSANNVARWNGTTWAPLGTGTNSIVSALSVDSNGDVLVGGYFGAAGGLPVSFGARWNGAAWSPIGAGFKPNGPVLSLTQHPNGDLIVTGTFSQSSGQPVGGVARWDGTSLLPLGSGTNGVVTCAAVMPNGDIVIGGGFLTAGGAPASRIARWNGATWSQLGTGLNGSVHGVTSLPNGDVLATGNFTMAGGIPASRIARWNGVSWSPLGTGLDNVGNCFGVFDDGEVLVGGRFVSTGGLVAPYVGRLGTTCPATATASGLGCASTGGANTLEVAALPWVDATFRATGTGLPNTALVVAATSFTAIGQGALPLSTVLPPSPVGCDLLVVPDILQLYVTTTGSAESSFFLPNTPPIVGLTFFHQMVPFEVDAMGNFVEITATNALQLTAGMF